MSCRPTCLVAILLLAVAPISLLSAQDPQKPPPPPPAKGAPGGDDTAKLAEQESADGEKVAEGLAKVDVSTPRDGLRSWVVPILSFKPRRLAPGETGEAHIVLALQRSAVIRPSDHLELNYSQQQGPIGLGPWRALEAGLGTLPTAFKGQPCYDNTVTLILPVTVAAGTPYQDYTLQFGIVSDIVDGDSGAVQGRFTMDFTGPLTVGDPLPRPVPRPGAGTGATEASSPAEAVGSTRAAPEGDEPSLAGDRASTGPSGASVSAVPGEMPAGELRTDGDLPMPEPAGGAASLLLVGGGVLVLALVVLLLVGRRSGSG
jgi:hypothetical protein